MMLAETWEPQNSKPKCAIPQNSRNPIFRWHWPDLFCWKHKWFLKRWKYCKENARVMKSIFILAWITLTRNTYVILLTSFYVRCKRLSVLMLLVLCGDCVSLWFTACLLYCTLLCLSGFLFALYFVAPGFPVFVYIVGMIIGLGIDCIKSTQKLLKVVVLCLKHTFQSSVMYFTKADSFC